MRLRGLGTRDYYLFLIIVWFRAISALEYSHSSADTTMLTCVILIGVLFCFCRVLLLYVG